MTEKMEAEQEERVKERQRRRGKEGKEGKNVYFACAHSVPNTHTVTTESVCVLSQTFDTTT